jgi:hypothetical protein
MSYSEDYLQLRADDLCLTKIDSIHCECEFCDNPSLGMYVRVCGHEYVEAEYYVCGYCLATGFDLSKQQIKLPF